MLQHVYLENYATLIYIYKIQKFKQEKLPKEQNCSFSMKTLL